MHVSVAAMQLVRSLEQRLFKNEAAASGHPRAPPGGFGTADSTKRGFPIFVSGLAINANASVGRLSEMQFA